MALSGLLPDAPTPPNPVATAAAQTGTNVATAVANSYLNNINQSTPTGSLTYNTGTPYSWSDPSTGQTYSIPRWSVNQSLTQPQQNIFDLGQQTQTNLANMAQNQSQSLGDFLGKPFNPLQTGQQLSDPMAYFNAYPDIQQAYQQSHLPGETPAAFAVRHYQNNGAAEGRTAGASYVTPPNAGDASSLNVGQAQGDIADVGQQQSTFGDAGQQQSTFGDAGDITRSYGPADNFSADRQRVEESLYQRMDPQLQRDRAALDAKLADQGVQYGSPAYQAAHDQFERQVTDTRLGITQTAGQEQQRMMDMAAQQAGFQNAAQQQAYTQAQGRGQFANDAQAQMFAQAQARGSFANSAQQQNFAQAAARNTASNAALAQNQAQAQNIFNARNAQRQQYLSEQYQQRNQPINEITSLLSGSQVQMPQQLSTPTSQIPTTDFAGILNNRFSQDMSIYQQQSNNFNSLMGGILGAAGGIGGGYLRSDRRSKENIDRIGTIFGVNDDRDENLPIYRYSYKDDPMSVRHIGPMAQDVEEIDPHAVRTFGKTKYIDKTRLGSILKVA